MLKTFGGKNTGTCFVIQACASAAQTKLTLSLTVLDVVVHLVVGPDPALVAVRVHAIVHVVNVRVFDVAEDIDVVKNTGVGPSFGDMRRRRTVREWVTAAKARRANLKQRLPAATKRLFFP